MTKQKTALCSVKKTFLSGNKSIQCSLTLCCNSDCALVAAAASSLHCSLPCSPGTQLTTARRPRLLQHNLMACPLALPKSHAEDAAALMLASSSEDTHCVSGKADSGQHSTVLYVSPPLPTAGPTCVLTDTQQSLRCYNQTTHLCTFKPP